MLKLSGKRAITLGKVVWDWKIIFQFSKDPAMLFDGFIMELLWAKREVFRIAHNSCFLGVLTRRMMLLESNPGAEKYSGWPSLGTTCTPVNKAFFFFL